MSISGKNGHERLAGKAVWRNPPFFVDRAVFRVKMAPSRR
jgi:hypothetical protein